MKSNVSIEEAIPEFYEWPKQWMGFDIDREYGERLLRLFEPFALRLIDRHLSKRVFRKHIDNLWLLGGELIRSVSTYEEYDRDPSELLLDNIGPDGGPFSQHLQGEAERQSFDSTCRALYRFLA